jgi:hypothetical protein
MVDAADFCIPEKTRTSGFFYSTELKRFPCSQRPLLKVFDGQQVVELPE